LPLSFIASMSGLLTLIASPTNLIISELLVSFDYEPLGFFTITPIGIIAVITVIIYLYVVRHSLLPNHTRKTNGESENTLLPHKLSHDYELGNDLYHLVVPENSPLVDKQLKDIQVPKNYQLFILYIERKTIDGIVPFPSMN